MSWLKIDDGFAEHEKIASLRDRTFRVHVVALCYCARNLTDGYLNARALKVVAAIVGAASIKRNVEELVEVGLWIRGDDGHRVKDYLDYNPPAEKVKLEREKARDRMRERRGSSACSGERSGERAQERSGTPSLVPSPPKELTPGGEFSTGGLRAAEKKPKLTDERHYVAQRILAACRGVDKDSDGVLAAKCRRLHVSVLERVALMLEAEPGVWHIAQVVAGLNTISDEGGLRVVA